MDYQGQVGLNKSAYGTLQGDISLPKRETIASLIGDLERVVGDAYDNLSQARTHANSLIGPIPEAIANELPAGPAPTLLASLSTTIARLDNIVCETRGHLQRIESALSE